MIATKTLVVEKRLEEIFCYLPEMTSLSGGTNHPVRFGYGDKKELNSFLKNRSLDKVYPLIWLLYPYTENHSNTDVEVTNATFILAMSTNAQMENKERIEKTFGKVLLPLFYNMRYVFQNANILSSNQNYEVIKHPNYSDSDLKEKNAGAFIWDALSVTCDFTLIATCLRTIKF